MEAIRKIAAGIGVIIATVLFVAFVRRERADPAQHTLAGFVLTQRTVVESDPSLPRRINLIHGTKGDDDIVGTDEDDEIDALAGRDRIRARGGDDVLDGGTDADLLFGGSGNDTYVIAHHGGGADVIVEEDGADTLQLSGGLFAVANLELLRHGDDLLLRWNHDRPADAVLVRQWFAGDSHQVEQLRLSDGTAVALAPLAARARIATLEDLIHFADSSGARQ